MYQDQARPYGSQQAGRVFLHQFKHGSPGRGPLVFAVAVALVALAARAASLALLLSYRSTAQAQIRQLQETVSSAQSNSASNTYSITGQAAKISAIDAGMAVLAPYSQVSQDRTSPGRTVPRSFISCALT